MYDVRFCLITEVLVDTSLVFLSLYYSSGNNAGLMRLAKQCHYAGNTISANMHLNITSPEMLNIPYGIILHLRHMSKQASTVCNISKKK